MSTDTRSELPSETDSCQFPDCMDGQYCTRHQVQKIGRDLAICRGECKPWIHDKYWSAWERCAMPDQDCAEQAPPVVANQSPPPANLRRRVRNAGRAAKRAAKVRKRAPADVVSERKVECADCDHLKGSTCELCGCNYKLKIQLAGEECPIGKWKRWSDTPLAPPVSPMPYFAPVRRNLIMHVYPTRDNDFWRDNIREVLDRIDLFTGKRLVSIVVDEHTVDPSEVLDAFGGELSGHQIAANQKQLGEVVSFRWLLDQVASRSPQDVTFYCHSKGTTKGYGRRNGKHQDTVHHWVRQMYRANLDDPERVDRLLERYGTVGAFRRQSDLDRAPWFWSGAFFWFRHWWTFQREWQDISNRFTGVESWPGRLFFSPEAAVLVRDNVGSLYRPETWEPIDQDMLQRRPAPDRLRREYDVTLVTCTGDRGEALGMLSEWVRQQTYEGRIQWIVVDDGKAHVAMPAEVGRASVEYVRVHPDKSDPPHTMPRNLQVALMRVKSPHILFLEDDEWYAPEYVESMVEELGRVELAGVHPARYYWPRQGAYREFPEHAHCSLSRTGIRTSAIDELVSGFRGDDPSIDMRLWRRYRESGRSHAQARCDFPACVGMKDMPGRPSGGGKVRIADPDRQQMREWLGDDADKYGIVFPETVRPGLVLPDRVVLYTSIHGGYDDPQPFPDTKCRTSLIYSKRAGTAKDRPPWLQNRWDKMHPGELYPDAEWTIYIDGQLQLKFDPWLLLSACWAWGDADMYVWRHHDWQCLYGESQAVVKHRFDRQEPIERAVADYQRRGIRRNSGLYLGGFLVRRKTAKPFNELWWREYTRWGLRRDQVSMPVAIQESGVRCITLPPRSWEHWVHRQPHKGRRQV